MDQDSVMTTLPELLSSLRKIERLLRSEALQREIGAGKLRELRYAIASFKATNPEAFNVVGPRDGH